MKKKHIREVVEAMITLDFSAEDVGRLNRYLESGDNGCPYTMSHTIEFCGRKGCRES